MKYAVIKSGGKQYKVTEGEVLDLERLPETEGKVSFPDVLLYSDGSSIKVGKPHVSGVRVQGVVVDNIKGKKIRVAKFKAKARYRRVSGHRQSFSRVKIETIGSSQKSETVEKKTATKKPQTKKEA